MSSGAEVIGGELYFFEEVLDLGFGFLFIFCGIYGDVGV